jgi:hypothetical protein
MRVKFIGRGTYFREIERALGRIQINQAHIAVNFGLQGDNLRDYRRRYPAIDRKPMLNRRIFGNKYECVRAAQAAGVAVPESTNARTVSGEGWITKPFYSLGGRDISRWDGGAIRDTHYFQKEITNRRYEIRVHAMAWVDPNQWVMQKRVHDDGDTQLTWNHHTGGRFITIENATDGLHNRIRASVITLMRTFGYQFGAVDFIVTNAAHRGDPLPHYFIEWNLAPGWTLDRIRDYYVSSFRALSRMNIDQVHQMLESGQLDNASTVEIVTTTPSEEPRWFRELEGDGVESTIGVHQGEEERLVEEPDSPTPPRDSRGRFTHVEGPVSVITQSAVQNAMRPRRAETNAPVIQGRVVREADSDDAADYEAHMREMAVEMNFCPGCGRPVNADIFGMTPRFCTGCGQQVRA